MFFPATRTIIRKLFSVPWHAVCSVVSTPERQDKRKILILCAILVKKATIPLFLHTLYKYFFFLSSTMTTVYEHHSDDDGFLYMAYSGENSMGN